MSEAFLNPTEAARRLGVSVKALRLYERHGLVKPVRSASGWRTYGRDQLARLHQVLALRRLGLPLRRIAELLSGRFESLDALLELQERSLARESDRLAHALVLVRAARAKLARGEPLSVDDLSTLTTETTMTAKATEDELKAIIEPIAAKHFTAEDKAMLSQRKYDQPDVTRRWDILRAEAKALMETGNPYSAESLDLARRWRGLVDEFTGGDPVMRAKVRAVWSEAFAKPEAAGKLPITPEMMSFVGKAIERLKETGG